MPPSSKEKGGRCPPFNREREGVCPPSPAKHRGPGGGAWLPAAAGLRRRRPKPGVAPATPKRRGEGGDGFDDFEEE